MNSIKVLRNKNIVKYLSQIDRKELYDDAYRTILDKEDCLCTISYAHKVVGFSILEYDEKSGFVFIYIFPNYRHRGYGSLAIKECENIMNVSKLHKITTVYLNNNELASSFAKKHGYIKEFASSEMIYEGAKFDLPVLPIRQYEDKDYLEAFTLAEEAFHVMRLSTGCFPNSKINEPSEESRKRWLKDADESFVYVLDNEVVGFANIDGPEIDSISIKISQQGKGLGRNFVKYLTNLILDNEKDSPYLWCVVGNKKARKLYESLGYKEVLTMAFANKIKE